MKKSLSLPIPKDAYKITEGWIYSKEEQSIHGGSKHLGIDYACQRGTPVFAATDGWAISSYKRRVLTDKKTGQEILYKGKKITNSRGYFVQIFHHNTNLFTEYYHLEKIADNLPFGEPIQTGEDVLLPVGRDLPPEEYKTYKKALLVKRGDIIGFVGDSGLTWGYDDYPNRPDPKEFPSWDETHLHFRVYSKGKDETEEELDPYDVYKSFEYYPWTSHVKTMGKNHLWLNVKEGLPR